MASKTNYNILLDVLINKSSVQKQVDSIAKKIDPIPVNIDTKNIASANKNVKTLNTNLSKTSKTQGSINKESKGFLDIMKHNITKTIEWSASMGLVYGVINQIRQGLEYISELNKEMVDIQIVTGFDSDTIDRLAVDYNSLGYEMGVTTLEVARGTTEWFRQGKTIEETGQLMEDVLMMSKLGNIESAQATEYATSILNGYKLETEDLTGVVDKLIAVDNEAATSVQELAVAMSRSASSAQLAGVSMEELVSYIKKCSVLIWRHISVSWLNREKSYMAG